jgi:hypothetical protein
MLSAYLIIKPTSNFQSYACNKNNLHAHLGSRLTSIDYQED